DITPNDPELILEKVRIYRAQGNLQEAAKLLSATNEQTPSAAIFGEKIDQLLFERNYGEAVQLLQARLAQFHFNSDFDKTGFQMTLAFAQGLAGDTAGAKVTAESARSTLEQLYKDQPDDPLTSSYLSRAYAASGEKDLALKLAQRTIMLLPRDK